MLLALLVGAVLFVAWYGYDAVSSEANCLATRLDQEWSYYGHQQTGDEAIVAERQLEAIARIDLKTRKNVSICPVGKVGTYYESGLKSLWGSRDTSDRWALVFRTAWWAVIGWYKYWWPTEYACVIDYKPSRVRVWELYKNVTEKEAGEIGTMTLYCDK